MKKSSRLAGFAVAFFASMLIFAASSYASLSDSFSNGLITFNNFFASNEYQNYAQIIDFAVFSLLFISAYMIGAKYGLKQIGKPEQVFIVVAGILSSFLLVSAGFSLAFLVPYIQYLLYFILFTAIWLLLKGIKSKFLRFLIALLLAALIVGMLSGSFDLPEINIQF